MKTKGCKREKNPFPNKCRAVSRGHGPGPGTRPFTGRWTCLTHPPWTPSSCSRNKSLGAADAGGRGPVSPGSEKPATSLLLDFTAPVLRPHLTRARFFPRDGAAVLAPDPQSGQDPLSHGPRPSGHGLPICPAGSAACPGLASLATGCICLTWPVAGGHGREAKVRDSCCESRAALSALPGCGSAPAARPPGPALTASGSHSLWLSQPPALTPRSPAERRGRSPQPLMLKRDWHARVRSPTPSRAAVAKSADIRGLCVLLGRVPHSALRLREHGRAGAYPL